MLWTANGSMFVRSGNRSAAGDRADAKPLVFFARYADA